MTAALSDAALETLREYDFGWHDPATTELMDAGLVIYDYVLTEDYDEDPLWTLTEAGEALRTRILKETP